MNDAQRQALEHFIAARAGARSVSLRQLQRLSGGAIQENWLALARLDGGPLAGPLELVIRADAPSGVSASHGRAQEFALLRTVFQAGVTVPEPLWLDAEGTTLGRPFLIMRRVAGRAVGHQVVKDPTLAAARSGLAERLGRELARIHSIRPPQPSLDFLPDYDAPPALHWIRQHRDALDRLGTPRPALEWGLSWLTRQAPAAGERVLCHRDFRTGNYMVDEQGLTAILDWEFAAWSDPLEDIGWFCARCWRFGQDALEAGGIGQREDFYRGYEQERGQPLDRDQVAYWEVMAHVNWAVIALQQAQRHLSGEEHSLLLALTAHLVPELEYEILRMTENG